MNLTAKYLNEFHYFEKFEMLAENILKKYELQPNTPSMQERIRSDIQKLFEHYFVDSIDIDWRLLYEPNGILRNEDRHI